MIDGIKLFTIATQEEINTLQAKCEFVGTHSIASGEINEYIKVAAYRSFKVTIVNYRNVIIQGSLHKSFKGGNNYNDFTFNDIQQAIKILVEEMGITANRFKIQRIEAGVNLKDPIIDFNTIERNVLMYRSKPFQEYSKAMGLYVQQQRYVLKIYDKSRLEKLPYPLLRVELKVIKSEHLKSSNINCLQDLTDKSKMAKLGNLIIKHFNGILMNNYNAMGKVKLTLKEKELYFNAQNPKYWKRLTTSLRTSKQRSFIKLVDKYTNTNLTTVLINLISNKWGVLITN